MFSYQMTNRYFALVAEGAKEIATIELIELGATDVKSAPRGLLFFADQKSLYRINYKSKLCTRICAPLLTFDCHSTKYLHKTAIKLPWQELLTTDQTFAIKATLANSRIKHSQYAALCLKDAIVDHFRTATGERPSIDRQNPDLWLDLYIGGNKATISIDTAGGSLHRRGYRIDSVTAPMQETLAAAVIRLSEWDGERPLFDPMCGSGTLLSEALIAYCKIPASVLRKRFGFEGLPDFDKSIWHQVKSEEKQLIRTLPKGLIGGCDISARSQKAAIGNLKNLPGGSSVHIARKSFQDIESLNDTTIICNPPYGIRLNKEQEAKDLIEEFGNFLKRRCTGSTAFIFLGKKELLKSVGLRPSWKKPLKSGGLDGVLAKYDMY